MQKEIIMKGMIRRGAMTLAVLMLTASWAWAQNSSITYIKRSWDDNQKRVVTEQVSCNTYTTLEGDHSED